MTTVLRYIGCKRLNLADDTRFNIDTYCEPFSGGFTTGFILLAQGFKGTCVLNDINESLIKFWTTLRDFPDELYKLCDALFKVMSNEQYVDDKKQILYRYITQGDELEQVAARYVYLESKKLKGVCFSQTGMRLSIEDFRYFSELLKRCVIMNSSYEDVLCQCDSVHTYFLIDPPYDIGAVEYYYGEGTVFFYHRGLRDAVQALQGKWLVTYNDSEYIRELYQGFNCTRVERRYFNNVYGELYISNYDYKHVLYNKKALPRMKVGGV